MSLYSLVYRLTVPYSGVAFYAGIATLIAMTSMAGLMAANAAETGGESLEGVHDTIEEVRTGVNSDFTSIDNDIRRVVVLSVYRPFEAVAFPAMHIAADFGYHHPQAAGYLGNVAPFAMVGVLGVGIYRRIKFAVDRR